METSASPAVAQVDPYVLEFVVNLKWLLRYAVQQLDPTVEEQYPAFAADVANLDKVLTHMSFERGCSLNDLPFGALRLSRESMLYLLVCDHLLGGCPPTMHPFLQRAYGDKTSKPPQHHYGTRHGGVTTHKAKSRDIGSTSRRGESGQQPTHADLNVSFPSSSSDDGDYGYDESGVASQHVHRLDAQRLSALNAAHSDGHVETMGSDGSTETQAALILLRWLFVEGVLSEEELAATLNLDDVRDASSSSGRSGASADQREELRAFDRHRRLAARLTEVIPFYMGAHLLVSRSILLQYSASLLTVDSVMRHVQRLEAPLTAHGVPSAASSPASSSAVFHSPTRAQLPYSALQPPTSVEGALLEWFQAIMDSARKQLSEKSFTNIPTTGSATASITAQLQNCRALTSFLLHGPFCPDVLEPAERDFFRLVQSGECLCVALWFYCPDAVPLRELTRALADAEAYMTSAESHATPFSDDERTMLLQRHQSVCYWTAILAAARPLGLTSLLSAEDVVAFGRTALPLHLFVFVQQLFAVLATNAEEEVRVSADTAWWEQMGNSEGYTEVMEARRVAAGQEEAMSRKETSRTSSAALPGAQHVLRQSMRDSFPPDAFVRAVVGSNQEDSEEDCVAHNDNDDAPLPIARDENEGGQLLQRESIPTSEDSFHATAVPGAGQEAKESSVVAASVNGNLASGSSATHKTDGKNADSVSTPAQNSAAKIATQGGSPIQENARAEKSSSNCGSSTRTLSTAATSTHFTVEFAHTQRGAAEEMSASRTVPSEATTTTAVLRPMVRRGSNASQTIPLKARATYSTNTFTSLETFGRAETEKSNLVVRRVPLETERAVEFATRAVVDAYARTPETEEPPLLLMTNIDDIAELALGERTTHAFSVSSDDGSAHSTAEVLETLRNRMLGRRHSENASAADVAAAPSQVPAAIESLPSSPKLPRPHTKPVKRPSAEMKTAQPVSTSGAMPESSASSLSYSTDFVVQSGPQDASEVDSAVAAIAVERSASLDGALSEGQALKAVEAGDEVVQGKGGEEEDAKSPLRVSSPPSSPIAADGKEEYKAEPLLVFNTQEKLVRDSAQLTVSTVTIKKFRAGDSDSGSDLREGSSGESAHNVVEEKAAASRDPPTASRESSLSTLSSLSPSPTNSAVPPKLPRHPLHKSTPASSSSSHSSLSSSATEVKEALPADVAQPSNAEALHNSQHHITTSSQMHSVAPETAQPTSPSVTDIAVENDGTLLEVWQDASPLGVRDSFPTPTEREEANRQRALAQMDRDDTSDDTQSPSQRTSMRGTRITAPAKATVGLPTVLSPLPARPRLRRTTSDGTRAEAEKRRDRNNDQGVLFDDTSQHTLRSEGSNAEGLSPLTPALTQSVSDVYGTDYASLLEDVASSYAELPSHRRLPHWDEESWFSSASHPHQQSIQSAAGSVLSVASMRDSTQVRDLLHRLRSLAVEDVEGKSVEELREALATQQQVVQQLTSVMQERRHRAGPRAFAAGAIRSTERRRHVRLRSPSEEQREGGASPDPRRSAGRSVLIAVPDASFGAGGESGAARAASRRRSMSGMTIESRGSPNFSMQSEFGGQLAETDVSSLLADILLPAHSLSPARDTQQ